MRSSYFDDSFVRSGEKRDDPVDAGGVGPIGQLSIPKDGARSGHAYFTFDWRGSSLYTPAIEIVVETEQRRDYERARGERVGADTGAEALHGSFFADRKLLRT